MYRVWTLTTIFEAFNASEKVETKAQERVSLAKNCHIGNQTLIDQCDTKHCHEKSEDCGCRALTFCNKMRCNDAKKTSRDAKAEKAVLEDDDIRI